MISDLEIHRSGNNMSVSFTMMLPYAATKTDHELVSELGHLLGETLKFWVKGLIMMKEETPVKISKLPGVN